MKTGDRIRIRKTDALGTVIEAHGHQLKVLLDDFPDYPFEQVYDDEVEPFPPVSIAPEITDNACVICGAATPEGRMVCGVCERGGK